MDGINHAELIKRSDTNWTIMRAPMLNEDPPKEKIEVGYVGTIKGFKLTREDLAIFIRDVIPHKKYFHKMPFLTNG